LLYVLPTYITITAL